MKSTKPLTLAGVGAVLIAGAAGSYLLNLQNQTQAAQASLDTIAVAPEPKHEFVDATCNSPSEPLPPAPEMSANSWYSPALDVGAGFVPSEILPISSTSNDGIIYSPSQAVGSSEGVSLLVGHVDYEPGALSSKGGELTAWGHLNELEACSLLYTTTQDGQVIASQVVSIIVAPQFDPDLEARASASPDDTDLAAALYEQQAIEKRLFTAVGDSKITLLTCSGPSVEDVGGSFQFRYANNLIIETTPIQLNETQ